MAMLCGWLTAITGKPHAVGAELRDYPVFLSVRSGDPGRIEALVATALAGTWTQDGTTVRLLPSRVKEDEGLVEFTRGWRTATAGQAEFSALPVRELYAMHMGEILRFGTTVSPYVHPLPDALQKKVDASDQHAGWIYVRRFSNGSFETRVQMPGENKGGFSDDTQIEFRSLPPEVVEALAENGKEPALSVEEKTAFRKLASNLSGVKLNPQSLETTDPLARLTDPLLRPLAKALKRDLVVALPDSAVKNLLSLDQTSVEGVVKAFSPFDDWTLADGALVGRLPVSERDDRAQTRRTVLATFIRSTQTSGVPRSASLATYLAEQRPRASESWTDVMVLILSGVVLDESYIGDYPFNLRLGEALTDADWARLRTGRALGMADLSLGAREALLRLLVDSRERMSVDDPDPVRWRGFPSVPLTLAAKVEEEDVVLGIQGGLLNVITPEDAGHDYRSEKAVLGSEPLYKPARRRKLTLTITNPAEMSSVSTGFADVSVSPDGREVPWTELPTALRKGFEAGVRLKDAEPAHGSTP